MEQLANLWFSQAALSAWLNCPLKFKYRYIDGLYWPLTTQGDVREHVELGRQFHLLAQRYFTDGGAEADGQLGQWLARLQEFLPLTPNHRFLPEYDMRLAQDQLRLLAKYDLLVVRENGVTIFDWKTDERPPGHSIVSSPQTRLYLYLLSSVPEMANPDTVQMVYWNPRHPREPLTIPYSHEQQEKDGLWLHKLVTEIKGTDVYPATANETNCRFCEYRPVCHGQDLELGKGDLDLEEVDWDDIQEIALQGVMP